MSEHNTEYVIQNQRPSRPVPLIPNEQLTTYPWFIPTCLNRIDANQILKSCPTIENGNFLVRPSENHNAKCTITLWFDNTTTHVRINQLTNGHYQPEFQPNANFQMPIFSTIKELIDHFSMNEMKLIGHCQGFVKLKFNSDILNYIKIQGGIYSYGS